MPVKVKICGITTHQDAKASINKGADALGFLVDIPNNIKRIPITTAKNIIKKESGKVWTFVLTISRDPSYIIKLCKELKPSHIQLIKELNLQDLKKIKHKIFNIKIVQTICVTDESSIDKAKKIAKIADFILLDTKINGRVGGTGKTHNWDISAKITEQCPIPVFLAGGLCPENLARAINKVKPFGVDADTKLEKAPGKKDLKKVEEFIKIAKGS